MKRLIITFIITTALFAPVFVFATPAQPTPRFGVGDCVEMAREAPIFSAFPVNEDNFIGYPPTGLAGRVVGGPEFGPEMGVVTVDGRTSIGIVGWNVHYQVDFISGLDGWVRDILNGISPITRVLNPSTICSSPETPTPTPEPLRCWLTGPTAVRTGDKFTINWLHNSTWGLSSLISSGWNNLVVRTNDDGAYGAPGTQILGGALPDTGAYGNICFTSPGSSTVTLNADRLSERATCSYTVTATQGTQPCISSSLTPTPTPTTPSPTRIPTPVPTPSGGCSPDYYGWIDGDKFLVNGDGSLDSTTHPPAFQPVTIRANDGAVGTDTSQPFGSPLSVNSHLQY